MTLNITDLKAREILDCRGLPTIHVDMTLDDGTVSGADVPAGRSTGAHEALDLRDGGRRYGGFGVRGAIENVNTTIRDHLVGTPLGTQAELDQRLIELDGTPEKSRLGSNAIIGVSLAAARAAAASEGLELYRWVTTRPHLLPVPQVNLINGGRHASNDLDFQEFTIMPVGAATFAEAMEIASEVNMALGELLLARLGKPALNTGDEGGYAPALDDPEDALGVLVEAVGAAGHDGKCVFGLDCAATHFFDPESGKYSLGGRTMGSDELIDYYLKLIAAYGIESIEDPLQEEDFDGFADLTRRSGIQIVGDDLFVTNPDRVARGAAIGAANSLLWKFNQVGTLSEAFDAAETAVGNGYSLVVSERSGETEDPIIADLVVGMGAGQIKTGAPVRGERTAKYNRLLQIENDLGADAKYAGTDYRNPVSDWR